ncbi:MAG: type II secretion system protein GspG [Luteolibacter sp.]
MAFTILIISTAIACLHLKSIAKKAKYAQVETDFHSLECCVTLFQMNAGRPPTQEEGIQAFVERPATLGEERHWVQLFAQEPKDPWNHAYIYRVDKEGDKMSVTFLSYGPDGIPGEDDLKSQPLLLSSS